jgi:hypothetical protein
MTKKDFKERCSFHQYGKGMSKKNAIFFDWQDGYSDNAIRYNGFKFMVWSKVDRFKRKELFDILYLWVNQIMYVPECPYRFADTDEKRFKVPLSL